MLYIQLKLIDERRLQHRFKDNLVLKSYLVTKNQKTWLTITRENHIVNSITVTNNQV